LHDLFITWEAVTPGEFKLHGNGITIQYGFHHTPFGEVLLARTDRGICHLSFIMTGGRSEALESLKKTWLLATLVENPHLTELMIEQVFPSTIQNVSHPLHLHLTGSNFQLKVWEALLRIPSGCVVSYRDIAGYLGNPGASRAVGNALAHNPVALLIPCHRVIHSLGEFGNYHYGEARKVAMLGWEMAKATYPDS
jgi:AraC family transcriptional regulator of adaptative response/methylated-DNA-[protein]-cysteine methyltransferase